MSGKGYDHSSIVAEFRLTKLLCRRWKSRKLNQRKP